ncbi:MAG TPA: carbamoyltransferase HypF [Bryobacteraceae bacterium]|nr:carbamoyltransferase HypF [Bryobacteraceae bacterium]
MFRHRIVLEGIVQGVGFRPFVRQLADRFGLAGTVFNDSGGVVIEIDSADDDQPRMFLDALRAEAPSASCIERLTVEGRECEIARAHFTIAPSPPRENSFTLTSPDLGTCAACAAEIRDPADRRFGYPFNNCTNCGPRYSITILTPYDRATTTMAKFEMCAACALEYKDPANRRFHTEPIACPVCGPRLSFSVEEAVAAIARGEIVAVKGLGGFQLACDARNAGAVQELRRRKRRNRKPFAVMVKDVETACYYFAVSEDDRRLLTDRAAPIVLLPLRNGSLFPGEVSSGLPHFGVMLPYTPLHHLLFHGGPDCLVMTSGNLSEEPIVIENGDAEAKLASIADRILTHNRDIFMRVDDSIARTFEGTPRLLRRARGYAPKAIRLAHAVPDVLAAGGELKNTFCITRGNYAIPSQHIGDLENYETLQFFQETWQNLRQVYQAEPGVIAHDLHPDYLSTRWALSQPGPKLGVQHHHAHVASCMAENRIRGPVIGVAFDGTGYGTDGQIWGGEFLVCDYKGFERRAHLRYVPLPGGDKAAKQGWRMAASHLFDAFGEEFRDLDLDCWRHVRLADWEIFGTALVRPSLWTSSCGRLFDSVAAICGVSLENGYEAESAMLLETAAAEDSGVDRYMADIDFKSMPWTIDTRPVIRRAAADVKAGRAAPQIAGAFHRGVAQTIDAVCRAIRERDSLKEVCLSGGTFQNWTLLHETVGLLRGSGFEVRLHSQVPPGDGGLSLGQAVIAAAFLER